ncbi:MAG: hypothetical protein ACKVOH_02480 [Chlamydiales bacterium]
MNAGSYVLDCTPYVGLFRISNAAVLLARTQDPMEKGLAAGQITRGICELLGWSTPIKVADCCITSFYVLATYSALRRG